MGYIKSFRISHLAGRHADYSQSLNREVNIFFGLNGSGKTSLLKILHSSLELDSSILRNVPFTYAEVEFFSVLKQDVVKLTIDKRADSPSESKMTVEEFSKQVRWRMNPRSETRRWKHQFLPTSRLWLGQAESRVSGRYVFDPIRGVVEQQSFSEEVLDLIFEQSMERIWSVYMTDILRKVRVAQQEGLASILKEILTEGSSTIQPPMALTADTAYKRLQTFLDRQGGSTALRAALPSKTSFEKRYAKDKMLQNIVRHIDDVEKSIELAISPRNKLEELIQKLYSGNKRVYLSDRTIEIHGAGDEVISLAQLSSGEKHILRILVETILAEDSPLIIDEPEISMHVDWQKDLIASMRQLNPLAQVILATHSPEIMADIPDEQIFTI